MKLIIGGAFQGKRRYAQETFGVSEGWADGETCGYDEIFSCRAIDRFHLFVKRFMDSGDLDGLAKRLAGENGELLVVTDELGCGVVPVDAFDRAWREKCGRVCTALAAECSEVHRVVCGIGTVIKHA